MKPGYVFNDRKKIGPCQSWRGLAGLFLFPVIGVPDAVSAGAYPLLSLGGGHAAPSPKLGGTWLQSKPKRG